jgi:KRAB domain-containing zinc finger protein
VNNKTLPGVTPCENCMHREVLIGLSSLNVPLRAHIGHKPYKYQEYGEKLYKQEIWVCLLFSPVLSEA